MNLMNWVTVCVCEKNEETWMVATAAMIFVPALQASSQGDICTAIECDSHHQRMHKIGSCENLALGGAPVVWVMFVVDH